MILHCPSCGWTRCHIHHRDTKQSGEFWDPLPAWECAFAGRAGHICVELTGEQIREHGL